jgi:MFS family permease
MDMSVLMSALAVQFFAVIQGGLNADQVGYVGMAGPTAYTISCFANRRLSDRRGRKATAAVALVLVACSYVGMALTGTLWAIVCLAVVAGSSIALFWPPVQAWLAEASESSGRRQGQSFSAFNICWSAGMMLGAGLSGQLYRHVGWNAPFLVAASGVAGCLVLVLSMRAPRPERAVAAREPVASSAPPTTTRFLYMAWYANFAIWFTAAAVRALFPKVGHDLGYTERLIGWLVAGLSLGQMVTFIGLRFTARWQYRPAPLMGAQVLAAGAMALAACASDPVLFGVAFFLAGLGGGVSYSCSLFYCLHGRQRDRAATTGLHEGIIGAGGILGPLLGGWAGRFVGLRAPFALAAAVCAGALALQAREWWLIRGLPAAEQGDPPAAPPATSSAEHSARPGGKR